MSAPRKFTGFKGHCMLAQFGDITFVVMAANARQLQILHGALLTHASEPFNPAACKKSILIEAAILPEKSAKENKPLAVVTANEN